MRQRALLVTLASMLLGSTAGVASAQTTASDEATTTIAPPDSAAPAATEAPAAPAASEPPAAAARTVVTPASHWRVRARYDAVMSWAPRYRLSTSTNELGLEQQLWEAVEPLPLYHRVSLNATLAIDEDTSFAMHFSGWGAVDMLFDTADGVGAGDVAIGYVELAHAPVAAWLGRRFLSYGPPGGLHVDGIGASVRADFGLYFEAFVGRPVTSMRTHVMGSQPDFTDATVAYGARVGYEDAGALAASASYAERWGHGIVGTRAVDVAATWMPGIFELEGSVKIDALNLGVMQARLVALLKVMRLLEVDINYLHTEPSRWISAWSILSAFETSNFDEVMTGVTVRLSRTLALRGEGAARVYTFSSTGEQTLGYRADVSARLMPGVDRGPSFRVQASRRGDDVLSYTVLTAGTAFDLWRGWLAAVDGGLALDDEGGRLSTIARANLDYDVLSDLRLGATMSVARTPFVESEARVMLRLRWTPKVPK